LFKKSQTKLGNHCITLQYMTIALCNITLQCMTIALHCTTLDYNTRTLHYITLHYNAWPLHYITLHHNTWLLPYITLHYIRKYEILEYLVSNKWHFNPIFLLGWIGLSFSTIEAHRLKIQVVGRWCFFQTLIRRVNGVVNIQASLKTHLCIIDFIYKFMKYFVERSYFRKPSPQVQDLRLGSGFRTITFRLWSRFRIMTQG